MGSVCAVHRVSKAMSQVQTAHSNLSMDTIPTFVPPVTRGTVLKVYDGDTIIIAAPLHINGKRQVYQFRVRLRGIDCPELRGSSDDEKREARRARDTLDNRIKGQPVILQDTQLDKYGRLLAMVFHRGDDLSAWMLNQGLAREYAGRGAKWRDRNLV